MKTIEVFYKEIAGSKELQDEVKGLTEDELGAFLRKHDCPATAITSSPCIFYLLFYPFYYTIPI